MADKNSKQVLPKTAVRATFLDLFHHLLKDHDIGSDNRLNLFCLRIANNKFSYDELLDELYDCLITFCLSRNELELLKTSQGGKKYRAARDKLRKYHENKGELGELLLYCFLESHLNAPKILSKLEIKTSPNHYVYGADGVHLLKIDDKNFQLVFGESKLNADFKKGVSEAFKSISEFIKTKQRFEVGLLNSQLAKESLTEESYKFLRRVILPHPGRDEFHLDHSFGIFLGFDYKLPASKSGLANKDVRELIQKETQQVVLQSVEAIITHTRSRNLTGHCFYVYALPFMGLKTQRIELIKKLIS